MTKTRLEGFSDGVLAIIITIPVLELKISHGETFASLVPDKRVERTLDTR